VVGNSEKGLSSPCAVAFWDMARSLALSRHSIQSSAVLPPPSAFTDALVSSNV